jgi:hypothetical protein
MSQAPLKMTGFTDRQALLTYTERRIEDLRLSLEAPFIDHRLADYYRGRIAELKELQENITE